MNSDDLKPLWMPKGSVRSIIALALTAAVIGLAFMRYDGPLVNAIVQLATTVAVFYFTKRQEETNGGQ